MTKKDTAGAAASPAAGKKRPASPPAAKDKPAAAQQQQQHEKKKDTHPLHDDSLPVDVVEEGRIFFFYRPRVMAAPRKGKVEEEEGHVDSLEDVQRTFMMLEPLAVSDKSVGEGRKQLAAAEDRAPDHGRPLNRIFVIPKKSLPARSGEARLAICVKVSESVAELSKGLEASTYETKTRGARLQPPSRVVASGAYCIVAPTAGPVARAARRAAEKGDGGEEEEAEEEQEAEEAEGKKKKARRMTAAEKTAAAAKAARHGRPVNSARLLWLLEAPRGDVGPAQQMIGVEHRGAFVIKTKGPLGHAGGGGGGWAPPPPDPSELPEPARARLTAARTQWVDVDTHAALDYRGAQMLMVAQYGAGGATGPGALEAGGIKQDRAAMAEEAGPEVAAALADLVSRDELRLKDDARAHGEPARGELGGALRRALLSELLSEHGGGGEEEGEDEAAARWAAHHEEAERQLRTHEQQEAAEEEGGEEGEGEEGAAAAAGGGGGGGGKEPLVVDPAITGEVV